MPSHTTHISGNGWAELMGAIGKLIRRAAPFADILVSLTEADPANVMEFGLILPEPSHEQEWFDKNRARLAESGVAT